MTDKCNDELVLRGVLGQVVSCNCGLLKGHAGPHYFKMAGDHLSVTIVWKRSE